MDEQKHCAQFIVRILFTLKFVLYSVVLSKNDFWETHVIQDENITYKKTFENLVQIRAVIWQINLWNQVWSNG